MRERYIPAGIMLIAGTATSIINIVNKVEMLLGLKRLLLVLILFYFIGLIAKALIVKAMITIPPSEEEESSEEEATPLDEIKPLDENK